MRDLKRYPVTVPEIEECLLKLSEELAAEELDGDMRPLLLRTAALMIQAQTVGQTLRRSPPDDELSFMLTELFK